MIEECIHKSSKEEVERNFRFKLFLTFKELFSNWVGHTLIKCWPVQTFRA